MQNLYEIEETDDGYQFLSETGTKYFISFINYPLCSEIFPTSVYMLNIDRFEPHGVKRQADQGKVRDTIISILDEFFMKHEEALISILDVVDGKQFARKRLFDRWFELFNNDRLCRLDARCFVDETETFVSLFFLKQSPYSAILENEFSKLVEVNFYN